MKAKEDEPVLAPSAPTAPSAKRPLEELMQLGLPKSQTPEKTSEKPKMPDAPNKTKRVRFANQPPSRHALDFSTAPKPAEPKHAEPKPAEPSPRKDAHDPQPPKADRKAVENPFSSKRDGVLHDFLSSSGYYQAPAFRPISPGEDPATYWQERQRALNKPPRVLLVAQSLLPPVLRHSHYTKTPHLLVGLLSEAHQKTLQRLLRFFKPADWHGCAALLPWNYPEATRYHYAQEPAASHLECHRRALRLEAAVSSLVAYISAVVQKTSTLKRLSEKALAAAHAVVSSGSGLYGAGGGFWTPPPPSSGILSKLAPGSCILSKLAPHAGDLLYADLLWLANHRQAAFACHYLVATELDWGAPLLGLVQSTPELLDLECEAKAAAALRIFTEDRAQRLTVYAESLKPLAQYGGRLTAYLHRVYDLAVAFKPLGDEARCDFPDNCKPLKIDDDGYGLGLDGRPSSLGHLQYSLAGKAVPPIPFPPACAGLDPLPPDAIATLAGQRMALEEARVLSLSKDEPRAIGALRRGASNVRAMLSEDSHLKNLTHALPPTASMPEAVFDPEVVFK